MKSFSYVIKDEVGLHARPAGLLVKAASGYQSSIKLQKGEKEADLKRLFAVLGLGVKCGDTVTVRVEGDDEADAAEKLEAFFAEHV